MNVGIFAADIGACQVGSVDMVFLLLTRSASSLCFGRDCVRCLNNARAQFLLLFILVCVLRLHQIGAKQSLCFLIRGMHRCPWSRDEIHLLVFFNVPEAVTLTSCCFGLLIISSNVASVGGRRHKPAEEQCAELQARARHTIIRADKKEFEDIMQTCSNNVTAFFKLLLKRDEESRRVTTTTRAQRRAVPGRRSPHSY